MFRVFQFIMVWSMELVFPFVVSIIYFLIYKDIKLSAITLLSMFIVFKIGSLKKYESVLMLISPFVILAISIFLSCHYLTGTLFWITFFVLVLATIVHGAFIVMFKSLNIQ